MKEYEIFLKKFIDSFDSNNPNNRIMCYEYQANERSLIKKLEDLGLIENVAFMGMKYVGFDLTYDAIHYFDENDDTELSLPISKISLKKYDVFLSHANKDKEEYVQGLYEALKGLGISIFYDKDSISWGDKWKEKIINGTRDSEFAIIVISKNYFGREWTEKELYEFLSQENTSGQKLILPIIHGITNEDLATNYPDLAEIQTISSADLSEEQIAILFANILIRRLKNIE